MKELYQEMILDHNKNPRNFGELRDSIVKEGFNPICGDHYYIYVKVEDNIIIDIKFKGVGCAISKASASMMGQALKGLSVDDAKKKISDFNAMLKCEHNEETFGEQLGKLKVFETIWKYPARVKCANLTWHTMKAILEGEKEVVKTE